MLCSNIFKNWITYGLLGVQFIFTLESNLPVLCDDNTANNFDRSALFYNFTTKSNLKSS